MATESTFKKDRMSGDKLGQEAPMSENFRDRAHDLVDRTADRAETVERALGEKADAAGESLGETREQVERQLKKQYVGMRKKARENPLLTVGIAFAAGAVVSRLISRR